MTFLKFKHVLVGVIFSAAASGAVAQVSDVQLQMLENPGILKQLQAGANSDQGAVDGSGIPSAETAVTQSTDNLSPKGNVVTDARGADKAPASVIENYFKILTGSDLNIYGAREFSQGQDSSLLFFNTVGREYRLAPGDVLRINLRGFLEIDGSYKVTRDGKITLASLPPVDVAGITIDEAEQKILELLRLGDASAAIYVSLDTGRLVTVQVSGGVRNPRTIAVPAYTPLSRVLAYVGGVADAGSLRNISLISSGGETNVVDFYDFLQNPQGGADPVITDSARIFVGDVGATVAVSGFVARPGIYELALGQGSISVQSLMKLSATNLLPPGSLIEVTSFDARGVPVTRSATLDDELAPGEALNVRFLNTQGGNVITVSGAVLNPYQAPALAPMTLGQLLKDGAVLASDAETGIAVVYGAQVEPYIIDLRVGLSSSKIHEIQPNSSVYVFSKSEYRKIIAADGGKLEADNEAQATAFANFRLSKKVSIFLDGKLSVILAPETRAVGERKLRSLATDSKVYPLYVGYNSYDAAARVWSYSSIKVADLFDSQNSFILGQDDQINFYSDDFIRKLGSSLADENSIANLEDAAPGDVGAAPIKEVFSFTDQGINTLLKSVRNVFGAVDRPGAYPMAGSINLADILSVAGGVVDGADVERILIQDYEVEAGRLVDGSGRIVDMRRQDPRSINLDGQYSVFVPFLINDAFGGTISVSGEVLKPGEYIFSRTETLQEVIFKAGGLSNVAYPLGVVLSRETVKAEQRAANALLASEVEASVLQLSQSDVSGAQDQIQAVLGFAQRLRQQEVLGRLTVNVMTSDPSSPLFLEDGDKVFVPKRPSYVSIIGSVQKDTMASYSTNKSVTDYIASAGGMNRVADRRRIYVLLPNGESVPVGKDTVIPPGSVIVVPPKTDKLSALGLTEVISRVMGNIATSILAINNVK